LYLESEDWPDTKNEIFAVFIFDQNQVRVKAVYKHPTRLGVIIPEMDFIPAGI